MRKNSKNYDVELLIFRVFLKHIKLHHLYHKFRCSVNIPNRHKDLFHLIASRVLMNYGNSIGKLGMMNPYYMQAKSLEEILSTMQQANGGKLQIVNNSKCQMELMNTVNGLIHSCIEPFIVDEFGVLEQIGEGVFTEVCKNLFGDDFVDKTSEALDPKQREMMEKFGRMMPPPQMNRRRHNQRGGFGEATERAFQEWIDNYLRERQNNEQNLTPPIFKQDDYDWEDVDDLPW